MYIFFSNNVACFFFDVLDSSKFHLSNKEDIWNVDEILIHINEWLKVKNCEIVTSFPLN